MNENTPKIGFAKQFNLTRNFVDSRPTSSSHAVSEQMRSSGRPIRFAKVRFQGYEVAEPAKKSDKIKLEHVSVKKHAPVAIEDTSVKKFPVEITDKLTGEKRKVFAKIEMRKVAVMVMGTCFEFTCKAGSRTVLDSRDGKRKPMEYVKSELSRLLGDSLGAEKFATLVA